MKNRFVAWDWDTTESISAVMNCGKPDEPKPLKKVMWVKGVSVMAQMHGDYGTTVHLTENPKGKTLCGRQIPNHKGHPAAHRMCKRCISIGKAQGRPDGFTRELDYVPYGNDEYRY